MSDELKSELEALVFFAVFVGGCLLCSLASLYVGLYAQDLFWRAGVRDELGLSLIELAARCAFIFACFDIAKYFATKPHQ